MRLAGEVASPGGGGDGLAHRIGQAGPQRVKRHRLPGQLIDIEATQRMGFSLRGKLALADEIDTIPA